MSQFDDVLSSMSRASLFPRKKVAAALYTATAPKADDCDAAREDAPMPVCPERTTALGNDMDDALRRSNLAQERIRDRNRQ